MMNPFSWIFLAKGAYLPSSSNLEALIALTIQAKWFKMYKYDITASIKPARLIGISEVLLNYRKIEIRVGVNNQLWNLIGMAKIKFFFKLLKKHFGF